MFSPCSSNCLSSHAVCAGEPIPVENGIVRRAGKSVIQMLPREHQMPRAVFSFVSILFSFHFFFKTVIFILTKRRTKRFVLFLVTTLKN